MDPVCSEMMDSYAQRSTEINKASGSNTGTGGLIIYEYYSVSLRLM